MLFRATSLPCPVTQLPNLSRQVLATMKELRKLAGENGWSLKAGQTKAIFETGVQMEKLRNYWATLPGHQVVEMEDWLRRKRYLDELYREYTKSGEMMDRATLEQYARLRLTSSLKMDDRKDLHLGVDAFRLFLTLSEDVTMPETSRVGSSFLPPLFKDHPKKALDLLSAMLHRNQLPARTDMLRIMQGSVEEDYSRARVALDAACSSAGRVSSEALDELLKLRLAGVEETSRQDRWPMLSFLDWLSKEREDNSFHDPPPRQWISAALQLWTTVYTDTVFAEVREASFQPSNVLRRLIARTCVLETVYREEVAVTFGQFNSNMSALGPSTRTAALRLSPELATATHLATSHLPQHFLVDVAHVLLKAVCITSPSYYHARRLYAALREKAPIDSVYPFKWHVNLLRCLDFLLRSALTTPVAAPYDDPRFVVQLYIDLTADGFTFPSPLWGRLWIALGRRGSTDELTRVLTDYKEGGRALTSRISDIVLRQSCEGGRVVKTLRVLNMLETAHQATRTHVSLLSYNLVLFLLASARDDRRLDIISIFSRLVTHGPQPDIESWNALIAAHVYRPKMTMEDLAAAGNAYTSLISTRVRPDGQTFSLLMEGFLRSPKRLEGIEGALRAFSFAAELGVDVGGAQTVTLIRALAKQERWEQAKSVGERWWRNYVVGGQETGKSSTIERGMLEIGGIVAQLEQQAVEKKAARQRFRVKRTELIRSEQE